VSERTSIQAPTATGASRRRVVVVDLANPPLARAIIVWVCITSGGVFTASGNTWISGRVRIRWATGIHDRRIDRDAITRGHLQDMPAAHDGIPDDIAHHHQRHRGPQQKRDPPKNALRHLVIRGEPYLQSAWIIKVLPSRRSFGPRGGFSFVHFLGSLCYLL